MRIISGTAGSIPIKVPPAETRPTTDRVRGAVFSMIADHVEGARVLDLFAGSGAMGLEALSRGAHSALFVEQHSAACQVIEQNISRSRLQGGRVAKADAFATLRRLADAGERFHLIFADPPYAKKPGERDHALALLQDQNLHALLSPGGVFVLETMVTKADSGAIANWDVARDRAYGSTRILVLRNPPSDHAESSRAADLQPDPAAGPSGNGAGSLEKDAAEGRQPL